MHRHVLAERGDFLGEAAVRPRARRRSIHSCRTSLRRRVQALDLVLEHRPRQLDRRQLRAVQDLVAVGVADAREQVGIGQRALDGVVADEQPRAELVEVGVERLEAAAIEFGQRGRAAQQVHRGPLLRRRLGQQQRAVREVERRQADLAGDRRALFFQRKRPAIIRWIVRNRSSSSSKMRRLPSRRKPEHALALGGFQRRIGGAQHERARQPDVLQRLAHDVALQEVEIDREVRNLRHAAAMIRRCSLVSRAVWRRNAELRQAADEHDQRHHDDRRARSCRTPPRSSRPGRCRPPRRPGAPVRRCPSTARRRAGRSGRARVARPALDWRYTSGRRAGRTRPAPGRPGQARPAAAAAASPPG